MTRRARRLGRSSWHLARLAVLAVLVVAVLAPQVIARHPWPSTCELARSGEGPTLSNPFGRDLQGCDYLARTAYGTRTSLIVSVLGTTMAVVLGLGLGSIAGSMAGRADRFVVFVMDTLAAIPLVLGAAALLALERGRTLFSTVLVLGLLSSPIFTRVVRAAARETAERTFVLAARAMGASTAHVMRRHVAPAAFAAIVDYIPLHLTLLIGAEATLAFLGVGIAPGLGTWSTSWGLAIAEGLPYLEARPHLVLAPTAVLAVAAFTLASFGHHLLDPRQRA